MNSAYGSGKINYKQFVIVEGKVGTGTLLDNNSASEQVCSVGIFI